ncbi:MAG: hypothetical protein K0B81_08510 [Candidatus Cloacimonetes bacterium]|nr:hypothetical protein [Candidatus Cloacimonadota bacterium]
MKKGFLIIITLLILGGLSAFQEGTINVGGSLSYAVSKLNEDADSHTEFSFKPQFGYFVMENLVGDVIFELNHVKQGDHGETTFLLGIGGRYFIDRFYAGAAFLQQGYRYEFKSSSAYKWSASYLELKAGHLIPVVEMLYVDLGVNYRFGIGEYGGDVGGDNEWTQFRFMGGLQFFFK